MQCLVTGRYSIQWISESISARNICLLSLEMGLMRRLTVNQNIQVGGCKIWSESTKLLRLELKRTAVCLRVIYYKWPFHIIDIWSIFVLKFGTALRKIRFDQWLSTWTFYLPVTVESASFPIHLDISKHQHRMLWDRCTIDMNSA